MMRISCVPKIWGKNTGHEGKPDRKLVMCRTKMKLT